MFAGAEECAGRIRDALSVKKPFMVLHFDCAGRGRIILSEQSKLALIETFQRESSADVPWAGFFTYGEYCPVGARNLFHNFTAVLAFFLWEDSPA